MSNFKPVPDLIAAVEARRRDLGWTATRMAQQLGMHPSHYSEFVHGKRGLSLRSRGQAYKLGVSALVLLEVSDAE